MKNPFGNRLTGSFRPWPLWMPPLLVLSGVLALALGPPWGVPAAFMLGLTFGCTKGWWRALHAIRNSTKGMLVDFGIEGDFCSRCTTDLSKPDALWCGLGCQLNFCRGCYPLHGPCNTKERIA